MIRGYYQLLNCLVCKEYSSKILKKLLGGCFVSVTNKNLIKE